MQYFSTPSRRAIKTMLAQVLSVTLVWVLLYHLSLWAFSYFEYNPRVYWVFLPAGIRMMAVFIFGWTGVVGLFIGSALTNEALLGHYVFGLSAISALSPMLALLVCRWFFALPKSLAGLSARQLLVFALVGALMNAVLSNCYFFYTNTAEFFAALFPMFMGDMLGTLLIFLLVSKALKCLSWLGKKQVC